MLLLKQRCIAEKKLKRKKNKFYFCLQIINELQGNFLGSNIADGKGKILLLSFFQLFEFDEWRDTIGVSSMKVYKV